MPLVTVDGTALPDPSELRVGRFELVKFQRTARGRAVREVIAVKRRLDLSWRALSAADMEIILGVLEQRKAFYQVQFPEGADTVTMTAYPGDLEGDLFFSGGKRYWRDVKLAFIEQ